MGCRRRLVRPWSAVPGPCHRPGRPGGRCGWPTSRSRRATSATPPGSGAGSPRRERREQEPAEADRRGTRRRGSRRCRAAGPGRGRMSPSGPASKQELEAELVGQRHVEGRREIRLAERPATSTRGHVDRHVAAVDEDRDAVERDADHAASARPGRERLSHRATASMAERRAEERHPQTRRRAPTPSSMSDLRADAQDEGDQDQELRSAGGPR